MTAKKLLLSGVALSIVVLVVLALARSRSDSIIWQRNYEETLGLAQSRQQPILTYLFTDWCSYCRHMDENTFTNASLIEEMGSEYVWLKLNAESESDGVALKKKFGITSYPTILILDSQGAEIDRLEGYIPPDRFKRAAKYSANNPDSFGKVRERAENQPHSVEAQYHLAAKYLQRKDHNNAERQFAHVIALDPVSRYERTEASHYYRALSLASQEKNDVALDQLAKLDSRFPDSDMRADAALLRGQIHYAFGNVPEARQALSTYLVANPDHRYAHWMRSLLEQLDETDH